MHVVCSRFFILTRFCLYPIESADALRGWQQTIAAIRFNTPDLGKLVPCEVDETSGTLPTGQGYDQRFCFQNTIKCILDTLIQKRLFR